MYSTLKITTSEGRTMFVNPKHIAAIEHEGRAWYVSIVGRRYPAEISEATATELVETLGLSRTIPATQEELIQAAKKRHEHTFGRANAVVFDLGGASETKTDLPTPAGSIVVDATVEEIFPYTGH